MINMCGAKTKTKIPLVSFAIWQHRKILGLKSLHDKRIFNFFAEFKLRYSLNQTFQKKFKKKKCRYAGNRHIYNNNGKILPLSV